MFQIELPNLNLLPPSSNVWGHGLLSTYPIREEDYCEATHNPSQLEDNWWEDDDIDYERDQDEIGGMVIADAWAALNAVKERRQAK